MQASSCPDVDAIQELIRPSIDERIRPQLLERFDAFPDRQALVAVAAQ